MAKLVKIFSWRKFRLYSRYKAYKQTGNKITTAVICMWLCIQSEACRIGVAIDDYVLDLSIGDRALSCSSLDQTYQLTRRYTQYIKITFHGNLMCKTIHDVIHVHTHTHTHTDHIHWLHVYINVFQEPVLNGWGSLHGQRQGRSYKRFSPRMRWVW